MYPFVVLCVRQSGNIVSSLFGLSLSWCLYQDIDYVHYVCGLICIDYAHVSSCTCNSTSVVVLHTLVWYDALLMYVFMIIHVPDMVSIAPPTQAGLISQYHNSSIYEVLAAHVFNARTLASAGHCIHEPSLVGRRSSVYLLPSNHRHQPKHCSASPLHCHITGTHQ
jgi:hypothetical protein